MEAVMKNEIIIHKGELRVSTWDIKDGFGFNNDHRYLIRMVEKYKKDFEEFGVIATHRQQPVGKDGGRPIKALLLNEEQALFLGTLFRNTPEVVRYKKELVRKFTKMRKELIRVASQPQNAQWLETRNAGKETRRIATDTIEKFIDYATEQGSKNAITYYANISKMENKALFLLEQRYKNLRDALDIHQLSTVKAADMIVMKALLDGMSQGLHYKEIYKYAKQQIESFAGLIGKTLIPSSQLKITQEGK
jgi:phage regulator Rha-like protein